VVASRVLGEDRWLRFAQGWFRAWATRAQPYRRLDCTRPGSPWSRSTRPPGTAACWRRRSGWPATCARAPAGRRLRDVGVLAADAPVRPAAARRAGVRLLADPPPGVFVDCLHFDPPFLTALGQGLGDAPWSTRGWPGARLRPAAAASGRPVRHFVLSGTPGTHGPGWGRARAGRCSACSTSPTACRRRPPSGELLQAVGRLVAAMVPLQRPDGSWPVVVTTRVRRRGLDRRVHGPRLRPGGAVRCCGGGGRPRTPPRGRCVPRWPA
jgi:unsaturated rhamnogalacturonyl hydrolase